MLGRLDNLCWLIQTYKYHKQTTDNQGRNNFKKGIVWQFFKDFHRVGAPYLKPVDQVEL